MKAEPRGLLLVMMDIDPEHECARSRGTNCGWAHADGLEPA